MPDLLEQISADFDRNTEDFTDEPQRETPEERRERLEELRHDMLREQYRD